MDQDFLDFLDGCVVFPLKTGLYKLNGGSGRRHWKMEKNMFFVIPEMPSKTFVMVLKKLPDYFNNINKKKNFLDGKSASRRSQCARQEAKLPHAPQVCHH